MSAKCGPPVDEVIRSQRYTRRSLLLDGGGYSDVMALGKRGRNRPKPAVAAAARRPAMGLALDETMIAF